MEPGGVSNNSSGGGSIMTTDLQDLSSQSHTSNPADVLTATPEDAANAVR